MRQLDKLTIRTGQGRGCFFRPDATPVLSHRPLPPTRTHHEPRSWSTARTQCQRDTSTTYSPHDTESATLDPPLRPRCAIQKSQSRVRPRGPGSAGDKAKGFRGRGKGMEKLEKEAP
ncbi:unnamed protein product [Pleuronectes platessa]|uniref:Uncharacterized protein n=1 Tax=Pleuronectes platessa TaxID=8262 RepID=A0A9N7YVU5_PLEPL|nr:unnamed protein product [Pleuronectes platessa]